MTITLKATVSPPLPARLREGSDTPRVEAPTAPTTRRPLGLENKAKEISVGGCEGKVYYLEPTANRAAVVYADSRMMTAIALSCLRAEGVSEERATELAVRALEAVYHGGNPELEKFGIKGPAMILPAEERNGAKIAHAMAHVRGGSENEAHAAEQEYLRRQPGAISYVLPPIDRNDYPNPDASPAAEGKIISFSLSVGGVGGAGDPSWGRPVQLPSPPPAGQSRVHGTGESEFARGLSEARKAANEDAQKEEDLEAQEARKDAIKHAREEDDLEAQEARKAAIEDVLGKGWQGRLERSMAEVDALVRRLTGDNQQPVQTQIQTQGIPPPTIPTQSSSPSKKSGEISLGGAGMGSGATSGQRNRGGGQPPKRQPKRQGQDQEGDPDQGDDQSNDDNWPFPRL